MACSSETQQNTTIHSQDSARIPVDFLDCAGVAIDVTGTSLVYTIHASAYDSPIVTLVSPTQIVIADDGESAAILLTPTHTARDGEYWHKLVLTDGAGNVLTTLVGLVTFSRESITCCDALTARIDRDLFVPGATYMLDFSRAQNAINFRVFLMR